MRALFHDPPFVDDHDAGCPLHGAQAVGYYEDGAFTQVGIERLLDLLLLKTKIS